MKCNLILTFTAALLFGACGGDDAGHTHADGTHHADHDGDDHDGDGDDHGDDGHDHSASVVLGKVAIGDHEVQATRRSELVAGAEAEFDLVFTGAAPTAPVRGWIGTEDGVDSRVALFEKEGEMGMHGHPEVPDPIGPDHRLWLEIEGVGKASLALK